MPCSRGVSLKPPPPRPCGLSAVAEAFHKLPVMLAHTLCYGLRERSLSGWLPCLALLYQPTNQPLLFLLSHCQPHTSSHCDGLHSLPAHGTALLCASLWWLGLAVWSSGYDAPGITAGDSTQARTKRHHRR